MPRLDDIASAIKSANAGAAFLTFDIVFADRTSLEKVAASNVINAETVARLYNVPAESVTIFVCEPVSTIKVTIPRATAFGGPDETDFDGVQQFAPLLDLDVS